MGFESPEFRQHIYLFCMCVIYVYILYNVLYIMYYIVYKVQVYIMCL